MAAGEQFPKQKGKPLSWAGPVMTTIGWNEEKEPISVFPPWSAIPEAGFCGISPKNLPSKHIVQLTQRYFGGQLRGGTDPMSKKVHFPPHTQIAGGQRNQNDFGKTGGGGTEGKFQDEASEWLSF